MKNQEQFPVNLPCLDRKQKSITETLSPLFRKILNFKNLGSEQKQKGQITMQSIRDDYSQLNKAMQNLQSTLHNRLGMHEVQLLQIMKQEIFKMLEDVRKVVKVYNIMIKQKNFSQDLWQTKNQVQYFKYEAIKLFQENKSLKRTIDHLKKQIQQLTFNQQCQIGALKKMAKKLAKQKAQRFSMSAKLPKSISKKDINNQQTQTFSQIRQRHQSLYTNLQKRIQKYNTNSITPRAQKDEKRNQSFVESTLSQSNKQKIFKTEIENSQEINSPLVHGYSDRVSLLANSGRQRNIKLIKDRKSLCKNLNSDQNIRNFNRKQQIYI